MFNMTDSCSSSFGAVRTSHLTSGRFFWGRQEPKPEVSSCDQKAKVLRKVGKKKKGVLVDLNGHWIKNKLLLVLSGIHPCLATQTGWYYNRCIPSAVKGEIWFLHVNHSWVNTCNDSVQIRKTSPRHVFKGGKMKYDIHTFLPASPRCIELTAQCSGLSLTCVSTGTKPRTSAYRLTVIWLEAHNISHCLPGSITMTLILMGRIMLMWGSLSCVSVSDREAEWRRERKASG